MAYTQQTDVFFLSNNERVRLEKQWCETGGLIQMSSEAHSSFSEMYTGG